MPPEWTLLRPTARTGNRHDSGRGKVSHYSQPHLNIGESYQKDKFWRHKGRIRPRTTGHKSASSHRATPPDRRTRRTQARPGHSHATKSNRSYRNPAFKAQQHRSASFRLHSSQAAQRDDHLIGTIANRTSCFPMSATHTSGHLPQPY